MEFCPYICESLIGPEIAISPYDVGRVVCPLCVCVRIAANLNLGEAGSVVPETYSGCSSLNISIPRDQPGIIDAPRYGLIPRRIIQKGESSSTQEKAARRSIHRLTIPADHVSIAVNA